MNSTEFRFKIEGLTPSTLSMWRQAEYMLELARLLGEKDHVRFRGLKAGSAVFVQEVDAQAALRVRSRLAAAQAPSPDGDLAGIVRRIDRMLADDNAAGELKERGQRVPALRFPGRDAVVAEIGPIAQDDALVGTLVRIGGEDKTSHATLLDGERTYRCEMTHDLARRMSPNLYGKPLRVTGRARWKRNREGAWELVDFKAADFSELEDASFRQAVNQLREVGLRGWDDVPDAAAELRRLRKGA
jgi:hypothetical protein